MLKEIEITGVMIQYYMICKRKLWFYLNQINMNYDDDYIDIGKFIHENSYKREKKEIRIDNIVLDYFQTSKDKITIFEIKKSSKLNQGSLYQLYYYIYVLRKANINADGMLVFPEERKKEKVELTNEIFDEITEIIKDIQKISDKIKPPKIEKVKPFCKKCSFMELCLI